MRYSRFELLAIAVGFVSIAGAVLATPRSALILEEVIAQVLLLVVLVGAVHWGRRGGTVTAVFAALAYFLVRVPAFAHGGAAADLGGLLLIRTITYAVVGIGGGDLCSRVRYLLARLESSSNIDEATALFNQRFIIDMLRSMIRQHERYGETFSIVIIALAEVMKPPRSASQRAALRAVAAKLRADVRLVDDVARLDDGRFLLVLPHTDKAGARIAANRVCEGARRLLGAEGESNVEVLQVSEDLGAIRELCGDPAHRDEGPAKPQVAA